MSGRLRLAPRGKGQRSGPPSRAVGRNQGSCRKKQSGNRQVEQGTGRRVSGNRQVEQAASLNNGCSPQVCVTPGKSHPASSQQTWRLSAGPSAHRLHIDTGLFLCFSQADEVRGTVPLMSLQCYYVQSDNVFSLRDIKTQLFG